MNHHLHEAVESAFTKLLNDSKYNQENIKEYREKIAELRQHIREKIGVLEQNNTTESVDYSNEVKSSRNKAINIDCQVLKQHLTDIAAHIQNQQTAEALNLIEPMKAGFSLLKIRVTYIDQLEKLLEAYQNEIVITQTLERVANALNIQLITDDMDTSLTVSMLENDLPHDIITLNQSVYEELPTLH